MIFPSLEPRPKTLPTDVALALFFGEDFVSSPFLSRVSLEDGICILGFDSGGMVFFAFVWLCWVIDMELNLSRENKGRKDEWRVLEVVEVVHICH